MVRGKSDRNWVYISSKDAAEFNILISKLVNDDKCFAIIEEWMRPFIIKNSKVIWELNCMQLYCPYDVSVPKTNFKIANTKSIVMLNI